MEKNRDSRRKLAGGVELGLLPRLVGYMLRQSQLVIHHEFHAAVKQENIRAPQFSILEIIHRNPSIRPSDISKSLGISRANLVPLLAELEAGGTISRKTDETDGRAQALHLTPSGVAKLKRLHRIVQTVDERFAASLGPDGRETLLRLLQTLLHGATSA